MFETLPQNLRKSARPINPVDKPAVASRFGGEARPGYVGGLVAVLGR
ncbi:hypothetical protein N9D66_01990 [Candidatus Nanopelagicales bacterium]|nr:hypothetical protein [Candidatus Nanopelagicales bacterium]